MCERERDVYVYISMSTVETKANAKGRGRRRNLCDWVYSRLVHLFNAGERNKQQQQQQQEEEEEEQENDEDSGKRDGNDEMGERPPLLPSPLLHSPSWGTDGDG